MTISWSILEGKKLTNMRASGKDEAVILTPPIRFSLEQAMEFIDDDELIEVTPNSIRLRKRYLLGEPAQAQRTRGAGAGLRNRKVPAVERTAGTPHLTNY